MGACSTPACLRAGLLCFLLLGGCGPSQGAADGGDGGPEACGARPPCARYAQPVAAGALGEPALAELSGLAASRRNPGVLYAHNDSGDSARFFALGPDGRALGEFRLPGASARDWEDMAVGPCPQGSCVFLGDVGDNALQRDDHAVYRVPEPEVDPLAPAGAVEVAFERFPFRYPQGQRFDCETLLVQPRTGELILVTKRPYGQPSAAFKFPLPLDSSREAELVPLGELRVPAPGDVQVTGGDIHPCGHALLLRMYNRVALAVQAEGEPPDLLFARGFVTVPSAGEVQGEAVAWSADGASYFTASEGAGATVYRADCE
jgi:hypothetical protein